ncbi:uncharacterized protein C1orf189 homolog isoform X1 [Numida meleagris]|uniref:uncharacterized protein C1orf189 homolog isoform X1 n=1 Tax=Numida meleagris TaxID=8996 RepID=UPI000B3E02C7|nr:uncharacterized protein C1orf189 homolog isoform X1 [Numida meleagris]
MMAGSSRAPSVCWEQILAKERAYEELLRRWEVSPGENPGRQERIWAVSLGALRWSLAAELRLASKELISLRRAALCRLLQDEHRQHQRELRQRGKAFHVERL